jgi:hypothetical protein
LRRGTFVFERQHRGRDFRGQFGIQAAGVSNRQRGITRDS